MPPGCRTAQARSSRRATEGSAAPLPPHHPEIFFFRLGRQQKPRPPPLPPSRALHRRTSPSTPPTSTCLDFTHQVRVAGRHLVRIEFEFALASTALDFANRVRVRIGIVAHTLSVVVFYFLLQPNRFRSTHIAIPDDPLVESLFRIKIASKTSHARWLSWVSTSSFSSIASGRGECRDSYHHETHMPHIHIPHISHTYIL